MDYCHVCRRHLNGALACAGCGTPAEELRQPDIIDLGVYDTAAAGASDAAPTGNRRARREREQPRVRTRRRARKRRGRLVLFGSAGVVLAAGALGLAELAIEPPANDRGAATAVHDEEQISQQTAAPAPDPSEGGPRQPSAVPVGTGRKSHPKAGGARPWPGASGVSVPGGARGRTGPSASVPPSGATGGSASPLPSGAPSPSASDSAPPRPGQPAPVPSPSASPTKTSCTKFLWWCV
ncbi:hypothetical protein ACGFRG_25300 [Streptomyces sp. NPDC048696]|uniref:SCO2400 family protein n=1 Tax=Streptomyces sp. NPDC048696 TaxID=3365585 RepID=UPI003714E5D2